MEKDWLDDVLAFLKDIRRGYEPAGGLTWRSQAQLLLARHEEGQHDTSRA